MVKRCVDRLVGFVSEATVSVKLSLAPKGAVSGMPTVTVKGALAAGANGPRWAGAVTGQVEPLTVTAKVSVNKPVFVTVK